MLDVQHAPAPSEIANMLAECGPCEILFDVPLSHRSNWRIGGNADLVYRPMSIKSLQRAWPLLLAKPIPVTVLGATTNLLFSDAGLRGVAVEISNGFGGLTIKGDLLIVGSGMWVPYVALEAMRNSLTGIEHIAGIPGTMGGLIHMNGGSQRRSISENIVFVTVLNSQGDLETIDVSQCGFSYRTSRFQNGKMPIVNCALKLDRGERSQIRNSMLRLIQSRKRFPRKLPNCGSVFISDPTTYDQHGPPGKLIENAGLKGSRWGRATISTAHANFIINEGGATAADVLNLIAHARNVVHSRTGVLMETEVRFVEPDGVVRNISEFI